MMAGAGTVPDKGSGMALPRVVEPELLDALPPDDPRAMRSRRDLRRVHRMMGTRRALSRALAPLLARPGPLRVLEIGAGDGTLMLGVAEANAGRGARVELTLLDRLPAVEADTLGRYARAGWSARTCIADVHDWIAGRVAPAADASADGDEQWDAIVAVLFLHHLGTAELARLLEAAASRCERFVTFEPRRGWMALIGSHCIGALGVNRVTRNDAVLSVHAGFAGRELTAAWPAGPRGGWQLRERASGLFGHLMIAARAGAEPA